MATTRIKDLSKTATTVASDANIVIDGSSNGTQKIARDNFRQDTADAYVAAPSTYKLTPLNGVNKIDAAYLPTSGDTPKGEWNANTNSPTLANGTGTSGDYYDVTTAGLSLGISFSVGDVVKYDGANWFKIDSVSNIFDGISTVDQVKTLAQVPDIGLQANQVPLSGMLNSGAWLDFDAFYEEGTWTPTVSFGGGSTGVAYNNQYGHYTKTGNMVTVQGFVYLSSKGSDTGTALINGLPYAVSAAGYAAASVVVGSAEVMTGLTSPITGRVVSSDIYLYDWGATGIATLTDANFGASALRFSATYQIA